MVPREVRSDKLRDMAEFSALLLLLDSHSDQVAIEEETK